MLGFELFPITPLNLATQGRLGFPQRRHTLPPLRPMSPPKVVAGPACVVGDEGRGDNFADSFPSGGPWTPRRRPRTVRKHSSDVLAGFLGYTGGEDSADCGRNPDSPPSAPDLKTKKSLKDSIGMYTVQCYKCKKWRKIPTKEEFETIRERLAEDPWFCDRDPSAGRSCKQPEDIPCDSSCIWVMDKPGIPRPPPATERLVIMRRDLSKMDTYYLLPNGKRARSGSDVEKFLQDNPEYRANLPASKFSFAAPKIVPATVRESSLWRVAKAEREKV
ncbi:methyl-CpG-binding domain-containing protein 4-like [Triticum dicoccoides]|uniref:methyl-CpG-binding domain-containing protein 4-like n=1 Tax=Triticum dicoccoides TaxID=85692 RepID=UPI001890207C|nr:methyl-CpG-binding domain-containing protein 4-like [Triticum dicoccoides]